MHALYRRRPKYRICTILGSLVFTYCTLLHSVMGASAQQLLPDLVPEIPDPPSILFNQTVDLEDFEEGCAGATSGRTLIRFTLQVANAGEVDLVVGPPDCPDCEEFPGAVCGNQLYQCSAADGHGHGHFSTFARYELIGWDGVDYTVSRKQGFCITDSICPEKKYNCTSQGLSAGCIDVYKSDIGCQYVDATDAPPGRFRLKASVNFASQILEADLSNNETSVPVEMCSRSKKATLNLTQSKRSGDLMMMRFSGQLHSDSLQNLRYRPNLDGFLFRLHLNEQNLMDSVISGGKRNRCERRDRWRVQKRGRKWIYVNRSGFLDQDCLTPAMGLKRVSIRKTSAGFFYKIYAQVAPDLASTYTAGFTSVAGSDVGPCVSEELEQCSQNGGTSISCTQTD